MVLLSTITDLADAFLAYTKSISKIVIFGTNSHPPKKFSTLQVFILLWLFFNRTNKNSKRTHNNFYTQVCTRTYGICSGRKSNLPISLQLAACLKVEVIIFVKHRFTVQVLSSGNHNNKDS